MRLKSLFLDKNNIGIEGAKSISKFLVLYSYLEILDLSHNPIKNEGFKIISNSFRFNLSLKKIFLNDCQISLKEENEENSKDLEQVLQDLRLNCTLVAMTLHNNDIPNNFN